MDVLATFLPSRPLARATARLVDGVANLGKARRTPQDIDAVNAVELEEGRRVSVQEASKRSDAAAGRLIELAAARGDRPFKWYWAETVAEAVLRNSYVHPRNHVAERFIESGDRPRGAQIFEGTLAALRSADAPRHTLGPAIYQVAVVRAVDGRQEEALGLLAEAFAMRADLAATATREPGLAGLRSDPRFSTMVGAAGRA